MARTMSQAVLVFLAVSAIAATGWAGDLYRPAPPDAQVTRFTRFNIRYTLRDTLADGAQKVEFYITNDMGRTWNLYGEDADRLSPMTIQVPGEGIYGFVCVATDRFGNREREPGPRSRPETVIIVDRTPPEAKWLAPTQDILGRNKEVEFKWETADPNFDERPVTIQFAAGATSNHDRNAEWRLLQDNLPATGTLTWTPPDSFAGNYNFRLQAEDKAGNLTIAYNAATLTIDSTPPQIKGVSPLKSAKLDVDIQVEADDGPTGSGVDTIALYASRDSGINWDLLKEKDAEGILAAARKKPGQAFKFTAEHSGEYGLWPVAFDLAGNASPLPRGGIIGPFVLAIDNEPPQVALSNSFMGATGAILANETRIVEWTSYDVHPKNDGGVLYLSLDNGQTWQENKSYLPHTGTTVMAIPFGAVSQQAKLKMTVTDDFGNVGESISEPFAIRAAETYIQTVTPVDQYPPAQTGQTSFPGFDSGYGAPPSIAPPQSSQPFTSPPQTTFPTMGSTPDYSTSTIEAYPPAPQPTPYQDAYAVQGTTLDPFSQPATVYEFPTAPAVTTMNIPGLDSSTAAAFPKGMTNSGQTQSSDQFQPAPPAPTDPFAAPAAAPTTVIIPSATSATPSWNPSIPGGQDSAPAPVMPTQPTTQAPAIEAPTTQQPAIPQSGSSGFSLPPLPGGSGAQLGSPADSGLFDVDSSTFLAPPPLPGPAAPGLPPPASLGTPTTTTPAFTTADPATPAPATSPLAAAPVVTPTPALPTTPALPGAAALVDAQPAAVQALPGFNDIDSGLTPPPMTAAGRLPSDPRQLSNYYAEETRTYLDEGKIELALDSAKKAMEADGQNPLALSRLAQVLVQQEPPNFAGAATLAKNATSLANPVDEQGRALTNAQIKELEQVARTEQLTLASLVDERDRALANAQIAVDNAAKLVQGAGELDRKQVSLTYGEIAYLKAMCLPEPARPAPGALATAQGDYRRAASAYRAEMTPLLLAALPHFQNAMRLGGSFSYREAFHMGIINFRLGGLEKDAGNANQAATYYEAASRYLEEATTTATQVPVEGPREAYYMLAYCHDQLADQPGRDRLRQKELALRYWRRTAEFYPAGTNYRSYSEQRVAALSQEIGQ